MPYDKLLTADHRPCIRRWIGGLAVLAGLLSWSVSPSYAVSFTVTDANFVGGSVYDFHYYNDLNDTGVSATVINGVNQGIGDPTRTRTGWVCCDQDNNGTPIVRYWKSGNGLTGDLTMGWDFSSVTGVIQSVELKTEHLIFQFGVWTPHATGDQIYGQIATPGSFGTGAYSDIYRETADSLEGGHGTNSLFEITSFLTPSWLTNPGLLELKLGYIKRDTDIPTRHIQVFRDDTGVGDDGFVLRVTLASGSSGAIPEPSTLAIFVLGLAGLAFMRRRRRIA